MNMGLEVKREMGRGRIFSQLLEIEGQGSPCSFASRPQGNRPGGSGAWGVLSG